MNLRESSRNEASLMRQAESGLRDQCDDISLARSLPQGRALQHRLVIKQLGNDMRVDVVWQFHHFPSPQISTCMGLSLIYKTVHGRE